MKRTGEIIQIMSCPDGMVAVIKEDSGALERVGVHGLALTSGGDIAPFSIDEDGWIGFPDEWTNFVKYDFAPPRDPKWLDSANIARFAPKEKSAAPPADKSGLAPVYHLGAIEGKAE